MKKFLKAAALIGAGAGLAYHCRGHVAKCMSRHFSPENRARMIVDHLDRKLNLSFSQKDALTGLVQKHFDKARDVRGACEPYRADFKAAFLSDTLDMAGLQARVVDGFVKEKISLVGSAIAELHALLTPEQRAKLVSAIEEHHRGGCCGHHFGHFMHGRKHHCC